MSDMLVQLQGIDFSYEPGRPVLARCDLGLEAGRRVGLVGATGSGKTTLLHLIVGLLRPDAGKIEAFGKVRARQADFHEVRRRVGLLFQDTDDQLFCPTVAEDVAFGPLNLGKSRGEVRTIVRHSLESLGLAGYEGRLTHKLSGGEKRLVALASVLAMQPAVLLMDEPTGGLDEQFAGRVAEIFPRLPQAMLIVSHNRRFLQDPTPPLLRLGNGRLEEVRPE